MKRDIYRERGPQHETFRARLTHELARRCADNPHYSLRAFALDLDTDHSSLSQVLRGKRRASHAIVERFGAKLGLAPGEIEALASADLVNECDGELSGVVELARDVAAALSGGPDYAILELVRLPSFRPDSRWIARVLGIGVDDVSVALQRLLRLGMLEMSSPDRWVALCGDTTASVSGFAQAAIDRLEAAACSLSIAAAASDAPRAVREHSSTTLAVDTRRLPEALARIAAFQVELVELLEGSNARDDVYRLEIHFFPLTRLQAEKDPPDA